MPRNANSPPKRRLGETTNELCGGKSKASGKPCKNVAGFGTDHLGFGNCKWHFGNSQAGIVHATKLALQTQQVQYGAPINIDPHQALLDEVHRAAGHVAWLEAKVRALNDNELSESTIGGKVPNFWIRWYTDERQRLLVAAATCIKAGVAERQVQVAEEQGRILAVSIRRILDQLGLSAEQQRAAPEVVRKVLTSVPIEVRGQDVA